MQGRSKVYGIELWNDGSVTVTTDSGSMTYVPTLRQQRILMNELESYLTTVRLRRLENITAEEPPK